MNTTCSLRAVSKSGSHRRETVSHELPLCSRREPLSALVGVWSTAGTGRDGRCLAKGDRCIREDERLCGCRSSCRWNFTFSIGDRQGEMAVNWTGGGSFLLNRQRRKQQASLQRQRHRIHTAREYDPDQEWLRNIRGGYDMPSEYASPPPPESTSSVNGMARAQSIGRQPSRESIRRTLPSWQQQGQCTELLQRSFGEVRRWLLGKPNWVGAKANPRRPPQNAEARVQPRPAPILASSSHSK